VRRIADLYTLTAPELAAFDRMGEASAAKVLRHIMTPRQISLAAFVAGFDFEGVGETILDKVAAAGFDTLPRLRAATVEELAAVHGLGEITAATIVEGMAETAPEMDAVLANCSTAATGAAANSAAVISIAPPLDADDAPLRGKSFCFTGELVTLKRADAEARVKAAGGSAKSSVVKDLTYLVTNDTGSASAKNKKAQALSVTIIDEKTFLELLGKR
jgi:DNA ligase (NAD+)